MTLPKSRIDSKEEVRITDPKMADIVPKFSLDDGIDELIKYYSFNKKNYHKNI